MTVGAPSVTADDAASRSAGAHMGSALCVQRQSTGDNDCAFHVECPSVSGLATGRVNPLLCKHRLLCRSATLNGALVRNFAAAETRVCSVVLVSHTKQMHCTTESEC